MELEVVRDDLESEERLEVDLEPGATVEKLLERLEVSSEEVLVAVDGEIVPETSGLREADEVRVMDVIAGG